MTDPAQRAESVKSNIYVFIYAILLVLQCKEYTIPQEVSSARRFKIQGRGTLSLTHTPTEKTIPYLI